jgi:hypothetical protein
MRAATCHCYAARKSDLYRILLVKVHCNVRPSTLTLDDPDSLEPRTPQQLLDSVAELTL